MKHKARTSPETLMSAARSMDLYLDELRREQQRLKTSLRDVRETWNDVQAQDAVDKIEKLIELVDRQITENEELCVKLKRKADRLNEYLHVRIR
jgi:prefoldin subunit 5